VIKVRLNKTYTIALLSVLGLSAPAANAVQQGDWIVRFGVSNVSPNDDSGDFSGSAGSGAAVDGDTQPSINLTYMLRDNVGLEVLGALPFSHDISATGALASAGKVASTKQLPPTFSVQYHFSPQAKLRPYAGIGINYTTFFSTDTTGALAGTDLELDDSVGLAAQLGLDYDINNEWFVNVDVRYINIETTATSSALGKVDVEINPIVFTLGAGFKF